MALLAAERIERPPMLFPAGVDAPVRESRGVGGGPTLDDMLVGVWEGLAAHAVVACLWCGGAMTARFGHGAAAVGGGCSDCGATIA